MNTLREQAMDRAGEVDMVPMRRMDDRQAPTTPLQWPAPDAESLWQDRGFLDLLGGYALAHAQGGMPVFDAIGALKDYTIKFFEVPAAAAPAACTVPPLGWKCTRAAGHDGPCAAHPANNSGAAVRGEPVAEPKTIGELFASVGGWMNGGELGYPSFGSIEALKIYTHRAIRGALSARAADAPSDPSNAEIVAIARQAIRDGNAMWDQFEKDENGKFTVPVLDPKDFMLVRAVLAAVKSRAPDALDSQLAPLRPTDDELWDATLRDRDAYHEWADKLADAIAVHFGVDIGEHSNQNLPWAEALEAIEAASSQPTDGEVRNGCDLKAVHDFLMGEAPLEGVPFGEKHPTKAGAFWWRLNLRAALAKG